ncbi:MAG: ATP-binding protein [Phycisphaeraceae bacterium]|nr:ATP-binding protein [Phycisphaerae bacterium]MBX3392285.1 ATP-binding protein [Phycisphaeraceae bacterium]HRJ49547.1 ATP-binding protein [Phycisphaerales bacterium]
MSTPPTPVACESDSSLPSWATELITLYESGAAGQFILHGNVADRILLPLSGGAALGSLTDFLTRVLLPRFDVVMAYDLASGIRVEKGGEHVSQWPTFKQSPSTPREPRGAVEWITSFLRYTANLRALGRPPTHAAVFLRSAGLVAPAIRGGFSHEFSALALQVREWAGDTALADAPIASFLITENLSDLNPLIVNNPRAAKIEIPLPGESDLRRAFEILAPSYAEALAPFAGDWSIPSAAMAGATMHAVESVLKTRQHRGLPIEHRDLLDLKKRMIEKEAAGLIDFVQPDRSLDLLIGQDKVKQWLRQDIELWRQNDLAAMPMGYLFCGPVGTGKTFMVECLAGEAGVPVVKLKNFRDRWVGSTESNLEAIFRLLHALRRCYVFIDEADQALGKRTADSGDSGVGGRVYSMLAEEMSNTRNRGRIVWVLASSRPDLIEVDLKRPGRIDVKIPLLPTTTPQESFNLIRGLCSRRGVVIDKALLESLMPLLPRLVTPGAAEAIAVNVYRATRTTPGMSPVEALRSVLDDYRPPVPLDVMRAQIELAVRESSDAGFIPEEFRPGAA